MQSSIPSQSTKPQMIHHQRSTDNDDSTLCSDNDYNEQIIKQTTSSLVHLYANTRVRITISYDFVDLSTTNEHNIGPDVNIDDYLKYGNKLAIKIDNVPKFEEGESTCFIFYLQYHNDTVCRELFRCACNPQHEHFTCDNIFIDYKDAMSTLIKHTRIIVTHCSYNRPWSQAVHFQAEIKGR